MQVFHITRALKPPRPASSVAALPPPTQTHTDEVGEEVPGTLPSPPELEAGGERMGGGGEAVVVPVEGLADSGDGGVVVALDDSAEFTPIAANALIEAFEQHTGADAIYGDIKIGETIIRRPAWSETRLITEPAACLPLAVRCEALHSLGLQANDPALPLKLSQVNAKIFHLPAVLSIHKNAPQGANIAELNAHFAHIGIPATATPAKHSGQFRLHPNPDHQPPISIIIPTAGIAPPAGAEAGAGGRAGTEGDSGKAVEGCLASIARLKRSGTEIILVIGNEFLGDPATLQTFGLNVKIVQRASEEFSFPSACNEGVLIAKNEIVLLLNDDTEFGEGSLDAMAVHFGDPTVGAVGALLRYPNGTIQHAGMVIHDSHPMHPFKGWPPEATQPYGGTVARDVIAVTGACLMLRRSLFLRLGGLSSLFPLSFNDVDLCLKMRRAGYRVVVEPAATALHHETLSREPVISEWERRRWLERWGEVDDPWYHRGFDNTRDPNQTRFNSNHDDPTSHQDYLVPRDTSIACRVHLPHTTGRQRQVKEGECV